MVQAVSSRTLSSEAWVRYLARKCGMCGGTTALRQALLPVFRVCTVVVIPAVRNNHLFFYLSHCITLAFDRIVK